MLSLNDYYFKLKPSSGSGSVTPTGTLEITKNGLYDVVNYGKANVNVEGSINIVKSGGTVVPSSGMVENVYLNSKYITDNPSEEALKELYDILSSIQYISYSNMLIYALVSNADMTYGLSIGKAINNTSGVIKELYNIIYTNNNNTIEYLSIQKNLNTGDIVYNYNFDKIEDLSNVISFNFENQVSVLAEQLGGTLQNEKLTQLFSSTPFESKVIKELSGDYKAVDIVVDELPSGSTPLGNNLNVEKIYFNTKLTTEEVDAILDTLTLDSNLEYTIRYLEVEGTTTSNTPLVIIKAEAYVSGASGYAILRSTLELIYASNETVSNFVSSYLGISASVGWNVSELEATNGTIIDVGVDGDKLTQLFSATPFVEPNTIDLEQYLDNKQMPMSVTVNVGGSSVSPMKLLLDSKKQANFLFQNFSGESVDNIISYSDTENVTDTTYMFNGCSALTAIPQLDTSKVTNAQYMFNGCSVLKTIPQLDTSKVSNMSNMFNGCSALKTIPQLDTSKVTNMKQMFYQCQVLTEIPQLDTSKVTSMNDMFGYCMVLQTIPQINMIKVTRDSSASNMLLNCLALTNLTLLNIKVNLKLGSGDGTGSWDYGHLLTLESLINTVKELINVDSAKTLTMGTANLSKIASTYVKFTDTSQTTIPTNEKGDVVVCESTDTGAMLLSDYALLKNWTLA